MPPINKTCYFCGSSEDIILPGIGIAWGMGGNDYYFCKKCLKSMSALEFWEEMFDINGYLWPPSLKGENND